MLTGLLVIKAIRDQRGSALFLQRRLQRHIDLPQEHSGLGVTMTVGHFDIVFSSTCLAALVWLAVSRRRRYTYPPGPPGFPVIGNLLDIPSAENVVEKAAEWNNTYGTLSSAYFLVGRCLIPY